MLYNNLKFKQAMPQSTDLGQ